MDYTLKIWDATTGQEKFTLKGHTGPVEGMAVSADGMRIASGSWDNTLKIWDMQTGLEMLALKGHSNRILEVAFSADGRRLVSASRDGTVKVWEAPPAPVGVDASKTK
jgi:WD40 repeat protein